MPTTSRLFFALWPDDETRAALTHVYPSIGTKEFKAVQPHNLHVTLVFLGHVNADTVCLIKEAVAYIFAQPFTLSFDSLRYWTKPKILCLTCQQAEPTDGMETGSVAEAALLAHNLTVAVANCGLQTDPRPYIPHITLGRHARYLPDVKIEPVVWRADAFCLVESCSEPDGVTYKVLQQWPFIKSKVESKKTADH